MRLGSIGFALVCSLSGAFAGEGDASREELSESERFWSFQPLARPTVPGRERVVPLEGTPSIAPGDVSSLAAWYRAETLDGAHDSPVRAWKDESGHGRDLVPTWKRFGDRVGTPPRLMKREPRAHATVRFRSGNGLGAPATRAPPIAGDAAYTLMIVGRLEPLPADTPTGIVLGIGDPAAPANPGRPLAGMIEIRRDDSRLLHSGGWGHNGDADYASARRLFDRVCVVTIVKEPGPMASATRMFVNGADLGPILGSKAVPEIRARADWGIFLGRAFPQVGSFAGELMEVLVFDTAIDGRTREGVEAGLVRKYGVTEASSDVHAIDAFVHERLEAAGLRRAGPADRRTLIRRASFDLLGLPPTPERVEAFARDDAPDAWEKLIDELLASKHYGERWGRHWLDVARYADTGGYETDIYFRNAWRYRDWVVRSFNDDKPYDLFVEQQIAADELWPNDLALEGSYEIDPEKTRHFEARIGTGLYALGTQIHESNMDARKLALERLTDWVDTTGSAFLGLTLGCARCHDHKFDPISQRDYYALQAVFASAREIDVPIVHGMGIADFKQSYPRILAVDEARRAYRVFEAKTAGRERTAEEESEQRRLLEAIANAVLSLPANDAQGVRYDGIMEIPTATVLGPIREPLIPAVRVLARGDLGDPRTPAEPALPSALAAPMRTKRALPDRPYGRRAELAKWMTRADHPLTWRVMANRIWQWHFGRGIVATASDFGAMGTRPSHLKLLDWLAAEFVDRGASVKAMHRLIMTSATYRRSSRFWSEAHERSDPENRLLWRTNRRRLEGEALWDAIHAVAGTLSREIGGRPVMPPLAAEEMTNKSNWVASADPAQHTRRGLYIIVRRNFRFPLFEVFDAPVNAVSCAGREVSTVAPQALWLLNNGAALGQAVELAARVVRETGAEPQVWIDRVFRLALARPPDSRELEEATRFLDRLSSGDGAPLGPRPKGLDSLPPRTAAALAKFCLTVLNLSEFLYID